MKLLAKRLVANEQGGPLSTLCVSPGNQPEHRTLGGIVVHAVTVLLCRNKNKAGILLPFDHMLHDPSALMVRHNKCNIQPVCTSVNCSYILTECSLAYNAGRYTSREQGGYCRIWAILW